MPLKFSPQQRLKFALRFVRRSSLIGLFLLVFFTDDMFQVIRDYDFYQLDLDENPVETKGRVTDRYGIDTKYLDTEVIEYKYQDLTTGEVLNWHSFEEGSKVMAGDSVDVLYWAENPRVSRIKGMRGSYLTDFSFRHFYLVGFGIFLILLGWIKGTLKIRKMKKEGISLEDGLSGSNRWMFPEVSKFKKPSSKASRSQTNIVHSENDTYFEDYTEEKSGESKNED